ncbi:hypothetical protein BGW38_008301 [Lunasporangiospora selenospora]|uniref:Class II aldolase/adducin N-terminal domain-containing protein n=1 Tax=Lunasporangiospora selenospora TaxID=979761 RepID=A0A9P6FKF2_9FUNG|nr:hypothetical protein BGW38_008301 [Lunasporangiospora selenospora]
MKPEDLFVLELASRDVIRKPLVFKPSACTPLFYNAYTMREAGACIHTHSQHAVLATLLYPGKEFAMEEYPDTCAVLVRRHGVYVWGGMKPFGMKRESWEKAKCMAECYDYLFEIAVKMKGLGIGNVARLLEDPSEKPGDSPY